jgi:predicted ATPase with chaperone activity
LTYILTDLPTNLTPSASSGLQPTSFETLKKAIQTNHQFALDRWGSLPARVSAVDLETSIPIPSGFKQQLQSMNSLRSRHKTLRIALSLQCMEQASELKDDFCLEALSYRWADRMI